MKPVNEPTQTNGNHRNAWNPERKTLETVNTTKICECATCLFTRGPSDATDNSQRCQRCSSNMTSNILHRTKRMQTNSCDSTRINRQLTTGHNTKRTTNTKNKKTKNKRSQGCEQAIADGAIGGQQKQTSKQEKREQARTIDETGTIWSNPT